MKKCSFCQRKLIPEHKVIVGRKYSYWICKYCLGGTLYPPPQKSDVKKIYQSKEYFKALSSPQANILSQWILTRRIYQTPAEWVIKNFEPGKILDVGCGNGEFLEELQKRRFGVNGVDVSEVAVKETARRIGKNKVIGGGFLKYKLKSRFNFISFWHVLEHLDKPIDYLSKSISFLNKGGAVLGEVPNFESPLLQLFGQDYAWVITPEHLVYFSKKSLRILLRKAGFRSVKVYCPPRALLNFSFSLERFLRRKLVPLPLRNFAFVLLMPMSIIVGYVFSMVGKGEVMRFIAKK